ncbi:MAG TPA: FAD binding domain-containing protein [Anaerolineae bacterium]|nr:FAD binding domain-containing protein [Anaerolineae bacterium]
MALWNQYHLPTTVDEAVSLLTRYAGQARVVAGGTDLLLELQQGRRPPVGALVDVTRVGEMTRIEEADGYVYVGAAVTHTAIVAAPLLAQQATCLVESCGVIGGPQVRNVATLGGNVAHGLPAGDGTLSLVALEAEAEIAECGMKNEELRSERHWHPIGSLFKGPGESAVDPTREVIVRFRFRPTGPYEATAFKRIMRPQGVALPILGMAVWLRLNDTIVDEVRIALGPAGPTPLRTRKAETYLTGIPLVEDVIPQVADLIVAEARLRTSKHRATDEYRRALIEVLVRRALLLAEHRARSGEIAPEGVGLG